MRFLLLAFNSVIRTCAPTCTATIAFLSVYLIFDQFPAHTGRAAFFIDMSLVFLGEIS